MPEYIRTMSEDDAMLILIFDDILLYIKIIVKEVIIAYTDLRKVNRSRGCRRKMFYSRFCGRDQVIWLCALNPSIYEGQNLPF